MPCTSEMCMHWSTWFHWCININSINLNRCRVSERVRVCVKPNKIYVIVIQNSIEFMIVWCSCLQLRLSLHLFRSVPFHSCVSVCVLSQSCCFCLLVQQWEWMCCHENNETFVSSVAASRSHTFSFSNQKWLSPCWPFISAVALGKMCAAHSLYYLIISH